MYPISYLALRSDFMKDVVTEEGAYSEKNKCILRFDNSNEVIQKLCVGDRVVPNIF